jgi:hypothetical protein
MLNATSVKELTLNRVQVIGRCRLREDTDSMMSTPGHNSQYLGEGLLLYFSGSEKVRSVYRHNSGKSACVCVPMARPFCTVQGASMPQAKIVPPRNDKDALRPESMPAPKNAGVTAGK